MLLFGHRTIFLRFYFQKKTIFFYDRLLLLIFFTRDTKYCLWYIFTNDLKLEKINLSYFGHRLVSKHQLLKNMKRHAKTESLDAPCNSIYKTLKVYETFTQKVKTQALIACCYTRTMTSPLFISS